MLRARNAGPGIWTISGQKDLGFSKTQAVVFDIVKQQGLSNKATHIIWMDNLFTSAKLLTQLKEEGFGSARTFRTTNTAREEVEEKHGMKRQKQLKEMDRGLHPTLSDLKLKYGGQLAWGQLYGELSQDGQVMELAWKDQNVVLFMTTVATGHEKELVWRRRPAATATNTRTARAVFGDEVLKELWIPQFIDAYNHFMNGVDVADQLRSYYNTLKPHSKTWKPLWHFLLDTAIVNAFIIYAFNPEHPWGPHRKNHLHRDFRRELIIALNNKSERLTQPSIRCGPLSDHIHQAHRAEHQLVRLTTDAKPCRAYIATGRKLGRQIGKAASKRKTLGELAPNSVLQGKLAGRRKERPPRSRFGCNICYISLSNHKTCWKDHIRLVE